MYNFTKRNVIKLLYAMTRFTFIVITLSLSLTGILRADDARSQNLKDFKVSLNFKNAAPETIFNAIEKQTAFTFTYTKETGTTRPISIHVQEIVLEDALALLAARGYLRFDQVDRMIKVTRKPVPQKPGLIIGKITDDKGEVLPGASVKVSQTGKVIQAAVDGTYTLSLAPGTYTLEVSFISFQSQQITDIVVTEGKNTALSVALKPASESLKGVTITSTFKKASIAGLYAQQKNMSNLSDGISAEQIGATPDKHVGETLKRITGVSTTDNKKVVIRGIAERYNVSLLNGSSLPSTDVQERDFEFNLIPTNLVDNIVVAKSITADMPYGFAGGLVQITTKSVPASNFLSVSAGTSFNSRTTGQDFMGYGRGKYDYLGFDDGSRNHFPDGLFNLSDKFDPKKPDASNEIKAAQVGAQNKRIGGTERLGTRTFQSLPSQNYQLSLGRVYALSDTKERKLGFVGSLSYRNTQNNDYIATARRGSRSHAPAQITDLADVNNGHTYGFNTTLGLLLNGGFKTEKHQINTYNLYTRIFDDQFSRITGWSVDNPKNEDSSKFPEIEEDDRPKFTDLLQNKLSGTHQLDRIKIQWDLAKTQLKTVEQDAVSALLKGRGILNMEPIFEYVPNSASDAGNGTMHRDQYTYEENNLDAVVSAAYDFKIGHTAHTFKTGLNYLKKHAWYNWGVLPISVGNFSNVNYRRIPVQEWGNYMSMENPQNDLFYYPASFSLNAFEAKSENKGAFMMLDHKLLPNLHMVWGMRADYYRLDTLKNAASRLTDRTSTLVFAEAKDWYFLPSANITYTPLKDLNVRTSYAKSAVRPGMMENSRFSRYNPNYGSLVRSSGVSSTIITNYDAKIEWFPGAGELLSVGYFYKYFDKPAEYYRVDGENNGTGFITISNSDWAKVKGWEFELRKSLGFVYDGLPLLSNIYVSGNLTLQKSQVRSRELSSKKETDGTTTYSYTYLKYPRALYGQVPLLYNLGMQYTGKKLGLNMAYNYAGYKTFITGNKPSLVEYERPRAQLDAQISYKFLKGKMETKLNMSNLLDAPFRHFINDESTYTYKPGQENAVGLEWDDQYEYKYGFSEKFEEGYIDVAGNQRIGDRQTYTRYVGRTFSLSVSYNF